jgi:hypothetical protein
MRRFTSLVIVLLVICLGGTVYLLAQRNAELRRERTQSAAAESRFKGQLADLQKQLATAEKARADSERRYQKMKAGAEEAGRAAGASQASGNAPAAGNLMDQMRKDPAYAALWHKQQLRSIQRQYGDAIAAMHLSTDQQTTLRDLLVARNEARLDAREEAQNQGLTGRELNLAVTAAADGVNDEIKAQIGDAGYQQLQQSTQVGTFKMMVASTVGVDLEAAAVPLSASQATVVAQGMSQLMTSGAIGQGQSTDPATGLTPGAQAVLDKISPSLTADQIPIVQSYLAEQIQQQAYFRAHPPVRR